MKTRRWQAIATAAAALIPVVGVAAAGTSHARSSDSTTPHTYTGSGSSTQAVPPASAPPSVYPSASPSLSHSPLNSPAPTTTGGGPSANPTVGHDVVCKYSAWIPFHEGSNAFGEGAIHCNVPPEVSNTTVILWRYDRARKQYYEHAHATSNELGTRWTLKAYGLCHGNIEYDFHSQIINDAYHGNWHHSSANSHTVAFRC